MPNQILLTDTLILQYTLTGDSGLSVSTCVTKSSAGHPKGTSDEKKMYVKQKYKYCFASVCKAYVSELTKIDKHLSNNFLDKQIKKEQLEFHVSETIT